MVFHGTSTIQNVGNHKKAPLVGCFLLYQFVGLRHVFSVSVAHDFFSCSQEDRKGCDVMVTVFCQDSLFFAEGEVKKNSKTTKV